MMTPDEQINLWKSANVADLPIGDGLVQEEWTDPNPAGEVTYLASCELDPSVNSLSDDFCGDYPSLFSVCPTDPYASSCRPYICA